MKPLRLWLPIDGGREREIIIPGEHVESIMLRSAEHEAGHLVAANHLQARVLGIAVGFMPERSQEGMLIYGLYGWTNLSNVTIEAQCVVLAAGPAADILFHGSLDEVAASGDLKDIEALTGRASLEPFLTGALDILRGYTNTMNCIADALRRALESQEERVLGLLPDNRTGVFLLDEAKLAACL